MNIANKSLEIMHRFLTEFGMTPSSRTRLHVTPSDDSSDEWDDFLNNDVAYIEGEVIVPKALNE